MKTPKGTELPILNLRGKDYLEVKYRIVWFREEHPDWRIETEPVRFTDDFTIMKAVIKDTAGNVLATAHKREDRKDFNDHLEKCETSAIGRALALIGFGTQFCADEMDEGERVVDSPVEKKVKAAPLKGIGTHSKSDPGEYKAIHGGEFWGKKIKDIDIYRLNSSVEYWEKQRAAGKAIKGPLADFLQNAAAYLESRTVRPQDETPLDVPWPDFDDNPPGDRR